MAKEYDGKEDAEAILVNIMKRRNYSASTRDEIAEKLVLIVQREKAKKR